MMSLLGLPKADTKSGSKAGSKDEMATIITILVTFLLCKLQEEYLSYHDVSVRTT